MSSCPPKSYRFIPTDEELISFYLVRKVLGQELPYHPILERQIYGDNEEANPWNVFTDDDQDSWQTVVMMDKNYSATKSKNANRKVIYAFTKLQNLSKKRINRTAGCGTWHGETGKIKIKNEDGQLIGTRTNLDFRINNKGSEINKNGHWIMYEYSLDGISLNKVPKRKTDYVVCKIIRDDTKSSKAKAGIGRSVKEAQVNQFDWVEITGDDHDSKSKQLGKRKAECDDHQERQESKNKKQRCRSSNNPSPGFQESEWNLMSSDMDGLMNMVDSDKIDLSRKEVWVSLR